MIEQKDYHLALLSYRTTPIQFLGYSPAELLQNRQLKTTLPVLPEKLYSKPIDREIVQQRDFEYKRNVKNYFDHSSKPLKSLHQGQHVVIKDDSEKVWQRQGVIVNSNTDRRQYEILSNGNVLKRNRRHLRPIPFSTEATRVRSSAALPYFTVSRPSAAVPAAKVGCPGNSPVSAPAPGQARSAARPSGESQTTVHPSTVQSQTTSTPCSPVPVTTRHGRIIKPPSRYTDNLQVNTHDMVCNVHSYLLRK